jgi:hypothetical protein
MPDDSLFTDPQWWAMCDFHMGLPVPLAEADLTRPFVYERRWGVFYVPMGMHRGAMSLLLAFQHGLTGGIAVAERLGLDYSEGTADHWLQHTPGAAMLSSQGTQILVGTGRGLTPLERRRFGAFLCAFQA